MRNLTIALIILNNSLFSQTTPCVDSSTRFLIHAGSLKISLGDTEVLTDSSVFITGTIRDGSPGNRDLFICRLDKNNNIIFSKKINDYTGFPQKLYECRNGDILLTSITVNNSGSGNLYIPWLFRFTRSGDIIWQKQIEATGVPYTWAGRFEAVSENDAGNIYFGFIGNAETNVGDGAYTGYYYIYKFTSTGSNIWRTTLAQNENAQNMINAINEKNGIVSVITQQYSSANSSCHVTNAKTIGLFKLSDVNGIFISSKVYCLNFNSTGCFGVWDSYRNSAIFLPNNKILICGGISLCDYSQRLFTLETDGDFNILKSFRYRYGVSYAISNASSFVERFEQVSLYTRGYNGNNFLYASIAPGGNFIRQRKLELNNGTLNSIGPGKFAFRSPDQFLILSNLSQDNNEVLQVMEFKGNNSGTADCTGKDTSFITSEPHTVIPIAFSFDMIRTEMVSALSSNFSVSGLSFLRTEICSSVSICDSLKISGNNAVCLDNPAQIFTVTRNPQCNKLPEWKFDTSAVQLLQKINDTVVQLKFKRAWQGYLYAWSNSCGSLLDSFFVKVSASPGPVNFGKDTTYCGPVILNAGESYNNYSWQDNSTNISYTVTGPGTYFVSATDICGNIFRDTI